MSPEQIREADAYTIAHEPISSVDLMERAASRCVEWIINHFGQQQHFSIFCGLGNNGGDGLAIARLLKHRNYKVTAYIVRYTDKASDDFLVNEQRLKRISGEDVVDIVTSADLPELQAGDIVIDALFGTGLSKSIEGLAADCIELVNRSMARVIAIDMPSGLFADRHTAPDDAVVKTDYTLSFQCPKLAFMFAENAGRIGEWNILDIGLSRQFIKELDGTSFFLTEVFISNLLKPREKFSHKGTYGHVLLIAGKYTSMGAAVLAAKACLRSGSGLLTVHVPAMGVDIIQVSAPEAMVSADKDAETFSTAPDVSGYTALGIGPGIGTGPATQKALHEILQHRRPMVLDADALNILGLNKSWLEHIPTDSILTPHPKEFERLTQKAANDFERHQLQLDFSKKYKVHILLKGAHSCLTTPEGQIYFNCTGNPGMAKGGSGDVLTGIITGILAQGYSPLETVLISMYVHGRAGDIARKKLGANGMTAGDIIESLPQAWMELGGV